MTTQFSPYEVYEPGQLIDAKRMNNMQVKIKDDIVTQTQKAVSEIKTVKSAENAMLFAGKTIAELTEEILQRIFRELPKRTGYLQLFKQLKVDDEQVIQHNLKAFPLVDVYQLDYFRVVVSEDGNKPYEEFVNFYLYHSSEKKIRLEKANGQTESIAIEPTDGHAYKIPFRQMLELYKIDYSESSSLSDLETEFWKAFFAAPNDEFDDEQYGHSPWFDRCCREDKNVGSLHDKGDWDDIWFQMRPRKTVNFPVASPAREENPRTAEATPAPTQIQIAHFDFDTLGIKVLTNPVYPESLLKQIDSVGRDIRKELKVMLLLKV
ncbi:MAG: hypothetical protein ACHBN1_07675 [Heteroscytonema crispum UTEX LB 1556]